MLFLVSLVKLCVFIFYVVFFVFGKNVVIIGILFIGKLLMLLCFIKFFYNLIGF